MIKKLSSSQIKQISQYLGLNMLTYLITKRHTDKINIKSLNTLLVSNNYITILYSNKYSLNIYLNI